MNEREFVISELKSLKQYGNITMAGMGTIDDAITIIREGDKIDRANKLMAEIRSMFDKLSDEYKIAAEIRERTVKLSGKIYQEARILTREELYRIKEPTLVWHESRLSGNVISLEATGVKSDEEGMEIMWFTDDGGDCIDEEGYIWRIWDRKPTDEERAAAPWQTEKGADEDGSEHECMPDDCTERE